MTVNFSTYEGKDLPEITYTDVIAVWFDDETWRIKRRYKDGNREKIIYDELSLDDYCIDYVHI